MSYEWRIVRPEGDDGVFSIEDEDGITICELAFTGGDEAKVARLICAAPAMYNACKTYNATPDTTNWIDDATLVRKPRNEVASDD